MAQVTIGNDGNLTVTLTAVEKDTVAMLEDDSLAQYLTLWIKSRWQRVVSDKFAQLPDEEKLAMLEKFGRATPNKKP